MKCNIFISVPAGGINIMELDESKLHILIDFYANGNPGFTIAGHTYSIQKLRTLKIFTYETKVDFEEFESYCIKKGIIGKNLGGYYFTPECLKLLGKDITEKIIGDNPFGYKAKLNKNIDRALTENNLKDTKPNMDIFISHSSKDEPIAKALIDLI